MTEEEKKTAAEQKQREMEEMMRVRRYGLT